ncbi:MAG: biotin-dependent carboxyltransferase family protein [Pseudomonadota bacterium]
MSFHILSPGPQAMLQAKPRTGLRHFGVPTSGPMDPLSFALANRLVGNQLSAPVIEITLGGFDARCDADMVVAVAGADAEVAINASPVSRHTALDLQQGDTLSITYPNAGCRSYVSCAGGFAADNWLGSGSTYLPAGVGGAGGRALRPGDVLRSSGASTSPAEPCATPLGYRPPMTESWALRAVPGPEATDAIADLFFNSVFRLSNRTSRMGGALDGGPISGLSHAAMPSAAVFPGSVQCPPDGRPFLLMADAQTTGGYPLIAQVIRADRHLMGQIRPGDRVRFLRTTPEVAADVLRHKTALFEDWLEGPFHLG